MSKHLWDIKSHNIPASHLRGYAKLGEISSRLTRSRFERGSRDEEEKAGLRLAVKQYTPQKARSARGDVTFIIQGGIDNSKESFEPFFDDLLQQYPAIRNIWIMDPATYGESFLLNRNTIGDEPNWLDIPRDILHMVNHFQELMPPPIIGIGHSLGGALMTLLSTWHPRLFTGLILTEPAYGPKKGITWPTSNKMYPAALVAKRRDTWPSKEEARKAFAKSPLFRSYDSRVVEKIVEYDLVDASSVKNEANATGVTLTTPKSITTSIWTHPRPKLEGYPSNPGENIPDEHVSPIPGFGRPEAPPVWDSLLYVHPPVLFIWGAESELFSKGRIDNREFTAGVLGTGHGGSGGRASGQVTEATIPGAHHHIPFERPRELAKATAEWSKKTQQSWLKKMDDRKNEPPIDHYEANAEIMSRFAKL